MSSVKDAYHHGDLRNALVATAVRLIEQDGLDEFSLRAAARAVGVSANAAYRHFGDKSELLAAVAEYGLAQLAQKMRRAMSTTGAGPDPAELAIARFKAVGRAYVDFALAHPQLFSVMFARSAAGIAPGWPGDAQSPYGLLGSALDELVAHGVLTKASRQGAELNAWATVHGFARLCLDGATPIPSAAARTRARESLLDFAVTGLRG